MESSQPSRARSRNLRITDRDHVLLAFMAEHRLVLGAHVQALLGASPDAARGRLGALARAGLLTSLRPFYEQRPCYQIRPKGLDAIASDLRPPRGIDLRCYEHDVGAAWLWLAARSGRFGAVHAVLGERRLRSHDATSGREGRPYGVRLGGAGPRGRERLHYPDLVLVTAEGRRIALELELSSKGRVRRERILSGYGADARIDAVLYLVKDRRVGRSVQDSARKLGIGPLVHVQQVRLPTRPGREPPGHAAERTAAARARQAQAPAVRVPAR